ncbi:protein HtrL-like [Mytilus californianus]|uniref:protein HtrL-like n=1 Tax=Mytilus californianus TaxID=6549 RepID=UPI00224610DE|nr:protein HtrL-like [Mytilus californianus]
MPLGNNKKENSATLVSVLYDINREEWKSFQRSFKEYLGYFTNILKLKTKLVLFCDSSTLLLLKYNSEYLAHKNIHTIVIPFSQLEYAKYRNKIEETLSSEEFKKDNKMLDHPEAYSADYIILMSNKLSFMKEAVEKDPFHTSHFFWIDAGYGHGNRTFFPTATKYWEPKNLLKLKNKITYIKLYENPDAFKGYELEIYKEQAAPVLNGAFFGGDKEAIIEYYHLYDSVFKEYLFTHNIVDDDQNIGIFCYYRRSDLFNLVFGDWNDVMKLFG